MPAAELDAYLWSGRTVKYHRAQIGGRLGYRECSVADADKLAGWLVEHVACKERRPEQVRVELLARCRTESIEPPTPSPRSPRWSRARCGTAPPWTSRPTTRIRMVSRRSGSASRGC
ncbi:DUF4158 domain-containing protein [Streptomyces mutabilis]|uniref:DUF4158 domain-containing protein n=1 Tax=Streptomyces mutabilis TaxID=67332 RepID=UPI000A257B64|nr:hypothetical protein B5181_15425 [Streptomyces sp. 4F]PAN02073.1 hypothetical protein CJI59_08150 [Streptomyces sp. Alain-F2R5]